MRRMRPTALVLFLLPVLTLVFLLALGVTPGDSETVEEMLIELREENLYRNLDLTQDASLQGLLRVDVVMASSRSGNKDLFSIFRESCPLGARRDKGDNCTPIPGIGLASSALGVADPGVVAEALAYEEVEALAGEFLWGPAGPNVLPASYFPLAWSNTVVGGRIPLVFWWHHGSDSELFVEYHEVSGRGAGDLGGSGGGDRDPDPEPPIPEPSATLLFGLGALILIKTRPRF